MELVLIAVLVVVVLGGAGFVISRRRKELTYEEGPPAMPVEAAPAPAEVEETIDEPVIEEAAPPSVEAPAVKPRFRDRLGKARGAVSGYLGAVLARDKVDPATWTTWRRR